MKTNRLSNLCKYAMILFIAWSFGSAKVQAQSYLLDGLSESSKTPTLAYSVRKLKSAYQGPAMRLFRSSDNDTVDVYFDANGIVSMASPVSASKGGAATSTTLETWVGANSAFVVIWYDQSGNGRNARNTTPIKKYNDYLITDGSAVGLLGNPVLKFDTCSAVTTSLYSVVAFNMTANTAFSKTKWAVSGPGIGLFTYINVENSQRTNWSFTAPPTSFIKGARLMTYPNSNTFLPSNVLMDEKGKYIGIVKSMESTTSFTFLKSAATAVYEPNKWGLCNLPCLVFEGKLQMINENMAALRVFNGTNSGSRLVVDTFRNDLGYKYMRKVIAFNLMSAIKLEGNFSASNGAAYFGSKATTANADRKFCVTAASSSTMVPNYKILLGSKFTATANTSYPNGITITRAQVKADNTGSIRVSMLTTAAAVASPALGNGFAAGKVVESIKIDTIKTWDATLNDYIVTIKRDTTFYTTVAGVAADALDETPIQLFGGGESDRNFEGLGSEFIFYASAKVDGDAPETDMDNVYVDQQSNFTSAPPSLVKPITTLTTTTATIAITVHRLGGIPGVTERGLYYGTTANTTSNEIIDAAPNTGDFSKALTGLVPNTKYYFRGYAANAVKRGYSDEGSFTTYSLAPDSVKPATDITYNSFRAHWVPISAVQGTEPYTYTLQVSRDTMFTTARGAFTMYNIPTTKLDTLVANNIMSDSTYYFRARVNNITGSSAWTKFKKVKIAAAPSAVQELKQLLLNVVPNPVSDKIQVTLEKSAMIQVYNITGQKVMEVNGLEGKNTISVTELHNGQYIVKVANRVAKIIKI